jgi:hypothetical protein
VQKSTKRGEENNKTNTMQPINERYIKLFEGITRYLEQDRVEEELKDFIRFEFAFKSEQEFEEIYKQFLKQLNE